MPTLPLLQSESLKWQQRLSQLKNAGLNPNPGLELARTDLSRIAQGGSALPEDQIISMVYSAYTGNTPVTQQPSRQSGTDWNPFHIIANVGHDITTDVRSFMPGLVHEGADIINPHKWEGLISGLGAFKTGSIGDMAKEIQALPIAGPLIPGLFALSAGTSGITHHPLNFLLDVAAFADTGASLSMLGRDVGESATLQALKEGHPVQAAARASGLEDRFIKAIETAGAAKPIIDLAQKGKYTAAAGLGLTPLKNTQWAYMPVWRAYNAAAHLWTRRLHDEGLSQLDQLGLQGLSNSEKQQLVIDAYSYDERYATPAEKPNVTQIANARGDVRNAFAGITGDVVAYTNIDPATGQEAPLYWSQDQATRNTPKGFQTYEIRVKPADITFRDGKYYGANALPNKFYTPDERQVLQDVRKISEEFDPRKHAKNAPVSVMFPGAAPGETPHTELYSRKSLPVKAQEASQAAQKDVHSIMVKLNRSLAERDKLETAQQRAAQTVAKVVADNKAGKATDAEVHTAFQALLDARDKLAAREESNKTLRRVLKDKQDIAKKKQQALVEALAKTPPSRYYHLTRNMVRSRLKEEMRQRIISANNGIIPVTAEGIAAGIKQAHDAYVEIASKIDNARTREELASIVGADTFKRVEEATFNDWQQLIQAGYDPIFIHHIKPEYAEQKIFGTIRPLSRELNSKDVSRMFSYKPEVLDIHAQLTGQMMDFFQQEASRQFIDFLANKSGIVFREDKLVNDIRNRFPDPQSRTQIEATIGKEYSKWKNPLDPKNDYYVPRGVISGLSKILSPSGKLRLLRTEHRVFEVAVMSGPRHLVHVALGGLVQVMLQEPGALFDPAVLAQPLALLKGLRTGVVPDELVKHHNELQAAINSGDLTRGMYEKHHDQFVAIRGGNKLGQWFDKSLVGRGLHTAEEKINFVENLMTNYYRAAVFLHKLEGGADNEAAMAVVNKVIIDTNNLTPFESTVIRQIFPFYSFTKHILRYVLAYPADHPLRASVLAHLAQNIEDTNKSGEPERLSKLFFLGSPDPTGAVETVDFSNLNPFRSMSSVFSMAGFLQGLAPEYQVLLRMYGLNTLTGAPSLHQNYTYDAYTGTRSATRPPLNPLDFASAFIPETEILDHFFQFTDTMKYLKANDPEAYQRSLWQEMNFPFAMAPININDVRAKAAAAQYREAQSALSNAMRTGNTDPLRTYVAIPFEGQLYAGDQVANYIDNFEKIFPQFAPKAVMRPAKRRKTSGLFEQAVSGLQQLGGG